MAIKNFPNDSYTQVIGTGEKMLVGSFVVSTATELSHMMLTMLKKGSHAGSEQFKLNIYESQRREIPAFTSSTVNITDFENITSADWVGEIRFDFSRVNLVVGSRYFVEIEPLNYIRSANAYYMSTVLDWPIAQNTQLNNRAGSKFTIWGYE